MAMQALQVRYPDRCAHHSQQKQLPRGVVGTGHLDVQPQMSTGYGVGTTLGRAHNVIFSPPSSLLPTPHGIDIKTLALLCRGGGLLQLQGSA